MEMGGSDLLATADGRTAVYKSLDMPAGRA
jgi:hypothetical protein